MHDGQETGAYTLRAHNAPSGCTSTVGPVHAEGLCHAVASHEQRSGPPPQGKSSKKQCQMPTCGAQTSLSGLTASTTSVQPCGPHQHRSLTRHPPPQLDAAIPRGRQKLIGGPQVQARHCIAVPCKSPQLAPRAWGIGIHVTVVGACQQHCRGVSLLCICGHDGCQRGQGDLTQLQGAHLQSQHKRAAGLTLDVVQMLEADQAPG